MPEIMRIEYAVCDESGDAFDWFDDRADAIALASTQDEPCYVEERAEYFPEKRIVWASHGSMIEVDGGDVG